MVSWQLPVLSQKTITIIMMMMMMIKGNEKEKDEWLI
jgi:hypothetical protein